jgi:hypothetical protein
MAFESGSIDRHLIVRAWTTDPGQFAKRITCDRVVTRYNSATDLIEAGVGLRF